jgi:two-component system cell cycle sensor histidine kinase/response regulator CckA
MGPRDFADRLRDMRQAEYGSRVEIAARVVAIVGAAVAVSLLLQNRLALWWVAAHFGLEACVYLLLRQRLPLPPVLVYGGALLAYTLSGMVFAAMPLYLIGGPFSDAVRLAAVAGLAGLVVYTLQRHNRDFGLMLSDCLQIGGVSFVLLVLLLPTAESVTAQGLLIFAVLVLYIYYVGALYSGVLRERQLREAQQRHAAAQKARALNQFVGGVAHDFNNQLIRIEEMLEDTAYYAGRDILR